MASPITPVDKFQPAPRPNLQGLGAGGALLGPQGGNLSPEQMDQLMSYLVPEQTAPIEKPKLDLSDLQKAIDTGPLPYDVRPLVGLIDSIYGTKNAQGTPNIREQIRAERTPNGSILQAQAQAKLADHQKALEDYYNKAGAQSPLERVKTALGLKKLATEANGGSGGDLKTQMALLQLQNKLDLKDLENKLGHDKEGRGMAMELMKDFRKEDAIKNFSNVNLAVKRVRNALFRPTETGVPQYGVIIDFIKSLDPQSTVMFNEAKSLRQAQGLYESIKNLALKWKEGKEIGPKAQQDMADMVAQYQRLAIEAVNAVKEDYEISAEMLGIDGSQVVSGPMKRLQIPNDTFYFTITDPKTGKVEGKEVDEDEVSDWVRQQIAAGTNPRPARLRK